MKIYVSHSKKFDYKNELYKPLRESGFPVEFILPHETSDEPFDSKSLFENKGCNYILAEVSYPSTGQGIELGWANANNIPVICIYKKGSEISGSLQIVSDNIVEYASLTELLNEFARIFGLNLA